VPKYAGNPITAFFFSTSGGHTENIENVWATSPQPYLKGVSDPYEPPYNAKTGSGAIYHVWRDNPIKFTPASVLNHLGIYTIANPLGVKGLFKTIYVVKRGTSPRVVTAYIVGDQGVTAIRGSTLGIKLGLRDSWAHFTSLSISPAAADKYAMNFGGGFALSGRMYPAVATGTKVTLHYYRDAVWQTMSMKTVRGQQALADGYTAHYSGYSFNAHPPKTTEYYITYGAYASPHTTVYVRPVLTLASASTTVTAGDSLTFTGTVTPALSGRTVYDLDRRRQRQAHRRERVQHLLDGARRRHRGARAHRQRRRARLWQQPGAHAHRQLTRGRLSRRRAAPRSEIATRTRVSCLRSRGSPCPPAIPLVAGS
jgi:hypothetical protein